MNRKLWIATTTILLAFLVLPASAPPQKPSLISMIHTNPIPLQTFDITLTTPTRAFVWNFTVTLAAKDPGSERFNLVIDASSSTAAQVPLVVLFSDQNLTKWLSEPLTTHDSMELAYAAFVPGSFNSALGAFSQAIGSGVTITFLPPSSGLYHIVILNPNAFQNYGAGVQASVHTEIHGYETWAVTTIS